MQFGITSLSLVSVREKPEHVSEQVSQLLFGETYSISEKAGNWFKITSRHDGYAGWINERQHTEISEQLFRHFEKCDKAYAAEVVQTVTGSNRNFPVLIGSTLHEFDGMNFKAGREKYVYSGQAVRQNSDLLQGEHIRKFALKFLHAPYQWGGRSPFGIDCSGFVQVVFKIYGINIPRDAAQQAETGKTINFLAEAREGDVAFFDDEDDKIIHTGIILQDNQIIHSSGNVHIDTIDHYGIFNKELKKYTHTLRIIKRLL